LNELVQHVAAALNVSVRIRHLPFFPLWCAAWACEMICKPFRVSPPLFRRRVDWFRQTRAFDITKAKQDLGYQPKVDLETGLARTARWYLDNHLV
jgi:nucleoside-diphosphate-sugar epimerase